MSRNLDTQWRQTNFGQSFVILHSFSLRNLVRLSSLPPPSAKHEFVDDALRHDRKVDFTDREHNDASEQIIEDKALEYR